MTQDPLDDLINQRMGKYAIQAEIGRGGMGVVYRGYDTMLQRAVAVKVLPPKFGYDQDFVERFRREAIMAANLHHPNIVTIHDIGEQQDLHYIVMEFLEGVTLEQWLRQHGSMPLEQIAQVVRQVAAALDYAHSRGVVHRDVKPSNIMLSTDMKAKLMDFGLVRAGEGSGLTRTGTVVGTPEYMAPEQALGQAVDGRTDIYALGVVLYRMLAGNVPFTRSSAYAVTYAHIHETPPPLRGARPDLGPAFEYVVTKALAKAPADRYQRAEHLARDLEAAVSTGGAGAGIPWAASTPVPAAEAPSGGVRRSGRTPTPATSRPAAQPGRQPRSLAPVLISVTALLLVTVLGSVWALSRPKTGGAPSFGTGAESTPSQAPAIVLVASTEAPTDVPLPTLRPPATQAPTRRAASPTVRVAAAAARTAAPTSSRALATRTRTATPTTRPTTAPTATRPAATRTSAPAPATPKAAPAASAPGIILDFENFGTWQRGAEPYGAFAQSQQQVHGGSYAAALSYDVPPVDNSYVVFVKKPAAAVPGQPQALTLWVYGDGANHFLNAWVQDSQAEVRQFTFGRVQHAGSWQPMTAVLDPAAEWPQTHISGPDNGRLDYPISLYALVLDAVASARTTGTIYLDDLAAGEAPISGATPVARAPASPAPAATIAAAPPAAAPGGNLSGHIVYAAGGGTIVALDVASGNRGPIAGNARQPDIHGDGLVVADGVSGGRLNLFTVTLGGGERIIGMHPEDSYPHWNPAGDGVVFHSTLQGDGKERIYIQWGTGQAQEPAGLKIGALHVFGRNATWLANGRIAFSGCNYWESGSRCGIWTLGPDGGGPAQLTERMDDISSDSAGSQLLYSSQITGNWDVYAIPAGGGAPRNLTNSPSQDVGATFSPDGQHVAFISDRDGGWGIWAMGGDGSGLRKLLAVPEGFGSGWVNERLAWGP